VTLVASKPALACVFASMYTFVKYAKLWDATRQAASQPDAR